MPKNFQERFQQYTNRELLHVQSRFLKEESEIKYQHLLDHRESKGIPENYLLLLH